MSLRRRPLKAKNRVYSGALPGSDVDGVSPDVVVELCGPDDARGDVTKVEPDPEDQVELDERPVELSDRVLQLEDKLHQLVDVLVLVGVGHPDLGVHPGRSHERRTDRLDLLHVRELGAVQYLVKVADQLVQDSQVLKQKNQ